MWDLRCFQTRVLQTVRSECLRSALSWGYLCRVWQQCLGLFLRPRLRLWPRLNGRLDCAAPDPLVALACRGVSPWWCRSHSLYSSSTFARAAPAARRSAADPRAGVGRAGPSGVALLQRPAQLCVLADDQPGVPVQKRSIEPYSSTTYDGSTDLRIYSSSRFLDDL